MSSRLACPRCQSPMQLLGLSTHQVAGAASVELDHCRSCRLVWFDSLESVQLDGLGWVSLLRELQQGDGQAPAQQADRLACPHCATPLREVHNQTRFGRFRMLECARHGHLETHAGLLAGRGLVRPLLGPERRALREEGRRILCLNCGAPIDGQGSDCAYCTSPLVVLDLPRLAQALRVQVQRHGPRFGRTTPAPQAGHEQAAGPDSPGRLLPWACQSCGMALDPSRHPQCQSCGHLVVVPSLHELTPVLDAAEHELLAVRGVLARLAAQFKGTARRPRPGSADGDGDGEAKAFTIAGESPLAWLPLLLAIAVALLWVLAST